MITDPLWLTGGRGTSAPPVALWEDPAPYADRALGPAMLDAVRAKYGVVPVSKATGEHILFPDGTLSGDVDAHSYAASHAMAAIGHPEIDGSQATAPFLQATGAARVAQRMAGLTVGSHHPMTPAMLRTVELLHAPHYPDLMSFSVGNDDMDPDQPHTYDINKIHQVNALATARAHGMTTSGKTELAEADLAEAHYHTTDTASGVVKNYQSTFGAEFGKGHSDVGLLPVSSVRGTEATSPHKVNAIRQAMRSGQSLPPVLIDDTFSVLDGHHRLAAAEAEGHTHIPAVMYGDHDAIYSHLNEVPPEDLQSASDYKREMTPKGTKVATPLPAPLRETPLRETPLREDAAPVIHLPPDDGHPEPGVTTNVTAQDKDRLKAITGHDNVHSLHRHLFGGLADRIEAHYHLDHDPTSGTFPDDVPLSAEGNVLNDKRSNAIGQISREFRGGLNTHDGLEAHGEATPRTMTNSYLLLGHGEQGHGIASRLYAQQEKYARDVGTTAIHTHADISAGPYAWAKQGFDFSPDQSGSAFDLMRGTGEGQYGSSPLEHYKGALHHVVTQQHEDGELSDREAGAHLAAIEGLKHSWDVANFDTGVHLPLETMDGKPGHVGKYVMTQIPYRQDYNGVKQVTPDASSPGEQQAASLPGRR